MKDEIKQLLRKCFGMVDRKFAMHPVEEDYARQLLDACRDEGIGLGELKEEATAWLTKEGCSEEHINEQLEQIEGKLGSWLDD